MCKTVIKRKTLLVCLILDVFRCIQKALSLYGYTTMWYSTMGSKEVFSRLSKIKREKSIVAKILKGSMDLIPSPSPSVKIQIMGGKVCLRCATFCFQKFVDNAQQFFAFTPQANFRAHNLNSHQRWRWWNWIQAIFSSLFYFNLGFWIRVLQFKFLK